MKNLTQLEEKTVNELVKYLEVYFDENGKTDGYWSSAEVKDLSQDTGIPMSKMRGVISSLIQKDIVYIEDYDCDGTETIYIKDNLVKQFI
tara:strand:- start:157 stop:426 length:270 start_codon:yes stop_codon:yes gene_type:complete